jgi:cytochrome bd ubiquinol oxidase subunit I
VFGERRLGRFGHFLSALAPFAGTWLSGYFIICTNAFMQHPVGHAVGQGGALHLVDFWALLLNPWALAQYAHNMAATVVTASFVVAAVGAYYALQRIHVDQAARFLRVGSIAGVVARACGDPLAGTESSRFGRSRGSHQG